MKKLMLLFCISCFFGGAQAKFTHKKIPKHFTKDIKQTDNTLTKKEKAEGWKLLFDGKTMAGLRAYKHQPQNAWYIQDGVLGCKKDSGTTHYDHADIVTDKEYTNYELQLDWKVDPKANSGILYMVKEIKDYDYSFYTGPEYQLLDDDYYVNDTAEHLNAMQKSGSNYDLEAPLADALNPVGQWNHGIIKVKDGHVEHWLNGKKTADYIIGSEKWKQQRDASKFKVLPDYAASQTGYIDFQDHGGGVYFKNIKIKE